METNQKLPLRRVDMSLTKFNEVAIPHHLDLLRQHKNNIIKFSDGGELSRVRSEQLNARRLVGQLRQLLGEMQQLRAQVRPEDRDEFDRRTEQSTQRTMQAIREYLENPPIQEIPTRKPDYAPSPSVQSTVSSGSIGTVLAPGVQLLIDRTELEQDQLRQKEECLKGWQELQTDMQELYQVYVHFQTLVRDQKAAVDTAEDNVEVAAFNVDAGTRTLARTERLKITMYPIAGAVIGGCLAGPIGLVAGLKVASAALIGGSILGFTGGSFLKKKQQASETTEDQESKKNK